MKITKSPSLRGAPSQESGWRISVTTSALKELRSLPEPKRQIVLRSIKKLATGEQPKKTWHKIKAPSSSIAVWEKRAGGQRILFQVDAENKETEILAFLGAPFGARVGFCSKIGATKIRKKVGGSTRRLGKK